MTLPGGPLSFPCSRSRRKAAADRKLFADLAPVERLPIAASEVGRLVELSMPMAIFASPLPPRRARRLDGFYAARLRKFTHTSPFSGQNLLPYSKSIGQRPTD